VGKLREVSADGADQGVPAECPAGAHQRVGERGGRGSVRGDDVAAGADLTVSFLSRLERGLTGVTVEKLRRLAAFWGLEIVHLFDRDEGRRPLVTRAGHGPALQLSGPGPRSCDGLVTVL
jgi:transcriptional regulator with XRE-family HTH domain